MKQEIANAMGRSEGGQTMAEYAVVLGVISITIVTALGLLSQDVAGLFNRVADLFS
jgi:Flp pilus assembly pilin Flp